MLNKRIVIKGATRALQLIFTVWGTVTLVFFASRLIPADPAVILAGPAAGVETVEALRENFDLNEPVVTQYSRYLIRLLSGDLGQSTNSRQAVSRELISRIPASIELILTAVLFSFILSAVLSLMAVRKPGGLADCFSDALIFVGTAVPPFMIGIILLFVFYTIFQIAPPPLGRLSRRIIFTQHTGLFVFDGLISRRPDVVLSAASHLVLPSITLGFSLFPQLLKLIKAGAGRAITHPAVKASRAAGISGLRFWFRYVFSLTAVPAITLAAGSFGYLICGSIIVEEIFGWNGLGALAVHAVITGDYNLIQGIVLISSAVYGLAYFIGDLLAWKIDPRMLEEYHG